MVIETWQITEFSRKIGVHLSTVDNWFKDLEAKRIHYVNRIESKKKIYDINDFKIAMFVKEYRDKNFNLKAIFGLLPLQTELELRPFPPDYGLGDTKITDEAIIKMLESKVSKVSENLEKTMMGKIKDEILPKMEKMVAVKLQEERNKRVDDIIMQRRVATALENEAISKWDKKPVNERMIKTGIFGRKIEDINKKNDFVKKYVDENFEGKIKEVSSVSGFVGNGD